MTTILLGAGASVPFFNPRLTTKSLTEAVKDRSNWENILEKYNCVLCDNGERREVPSIDEVMELIHCIDELYPSYHFEQIAEIVDKYCSIKIDIDQRETVLSSLIHIISTQSKCQIPPCDERWRDVPFLFREIIADQILHHQRDCKVEDYDNLQQMQEKFLDSIGNSDEDVTIVSLNYDECIVKSAKRTNFNFCYKFDPNQGFIQDVISILNEKKIILFPHGHLTLHTRNNYTEYYHSAENADENRWNFLFDSINKTITHYPAVFAYNFNTFITTGQSKDDSLNNEPFAAYYQRMAKDMMNSDKVIIIGYSFSDEHFNRLLKNFLHAKPENKVLIVDYYTPNITMTNEYMDSTCIITKLQGVFTPEWPIFVDANGNKLPINPQEVQKLNNIGHGEIFHNVIFYKKGYASFLETYHQILDTLYPCKYEPFFARIKKFFLHANKVIYSKS